MANKEHSFSSDRPITIAVDDLLGRAKFSQELALSISSWNEKDSLVVGIYGQWGDGKTSVKNMIREAFEKNKTSVFLEFSPWQWGSEDRITEAFFKELSNKIGNSDETERKLAARKMNEYAKYLELSTDFFGKTKESAEKLFLVLVGSSSLLSLLVPKLQIALTSFSLLSVIAGLLADQIFLAVKFIARWKNVEFENTRSLDERKLELVKALSKIKNSIIVIIDDIDRLSKSEIKALFRLIKANADFPNIVYLTLFQRDLVEGSLSDGEVFAGREYLKKIIQVGFNLPKVSDNDIHKILFRELDRLLVESGLESKFDQGRWNELFTDGISHFFKNLRDVNRFVSTFSFHLGVLKSDSYYEINFVDLLGIEVLRQFEPAVYDLVYFTKKLLTSGSSSTYAHRQEIEKAQMKKILESSNEGNQNFVKSIIKALFPNAQWTWGSNYHYNVDNDEFINLRVNHPDRFDLYFSLFLPENSIKQSDFERALSLSADEEALSSFLMEFYSQGKLPNFIQKFEAYKQVVDKASAIPFITAMLKIGDYLVDDHENVLSITPIANVRRIIIWYFRKPDFSEQERGSIYWDILNRSNAIFLPISLLWDEAERRNINNYPEHYVLSSYKVDEIKDLIRRKISDNKNEERFKSSIHLPRMVFIWIQLEKEVAEIWLQEYLKNDQNLISFLLNLEQRGTTSAGYVTTINYYIQLSYLKHFFSDVEGLGARVAKLKPSMNSEDVRVKRLFENVERAVDQYSHPENYRDLFGRR